MSKRPVSPDLSDYALLAKPIKSSKKHKEKKDSSLFGRKETTIPEIFKRNLKNLTDVGDKIEMDSFDLTETSITVPKTPSPPKKKSKGFLSRLVMSGEKKNKPTAKLGDQRLLALKHSKQNNNSSMVSSPSIMIKKDLPRTAASTSDVPEFNMTINGSKIDAQNNDFDKLFNNNQVEEKVPEDVSEKKDESKMRDMKNSGPEDLLPPCKEVSFEAPKINEDLIKYLKSSQNNLRQAVDCIKSMNTSIQELRRALASESET